MASPIKGTKTGSVPAKRDTHLFSKVSATLTSDLSDPKLEIAARNILSKLRAKGYPLTNFDTEEPQCLSCLYMALQNASDLMWRTRHLH